jgi:dephospho-CoA kinase
VNGFIGLTGQNCAGKGLAARILAEHGYRYYSLSDIVREEAALRGREPTRDSLIRTGNELRAEEGAGTLAVRTLSKVSPPCIIDSIRNPEEVAVLRKLDRFLLIAVTARAELRFHRMMKRKRAGDPETFREFIEKEEAEQSDSPLRQQVHSCIALADVNVPNNGPAEDFRKNLLHVCGIKD